MTAPQDMLEQATAAMQNAYVPYSNFPVGACFRSQTGELFNGCNIENASYGLGLCAEASALVKMISQGHKKIAEVLIIIPGDKICPPCGACRQRIQEFVIPNTIVHLCTINGAYEKFKFSELFPHPFSPQNLEEAC